jgi:DNA helicase-2/ATP-dependent DNA helicase PcrA
MAELNKAQKEAVEYVKGPLMIVAGAGTGKTTVITEKIAYVIKNNLAKHEEILALTFTEKAAHEMLVRVDELLETNYSDIQISTFHAFAQVILENYALDIGLPNQFKLLTQTDTWLLVREHLEKFNLDYYKPLANPTRHIHELIKHFNKCKDELITPEEYLQYAEEHSTETGDMNQEEGSRLKELANAYHVYNRLLLENNALDFGDLIFYTIKLLQTRPVILKKIQERFKFILVDEFQDVNWAQYKLIQLLTGPQNQLTIVGDDDQSIYAFRGASVANILRFKDDFPNCHEVVLNENYRSDQTILDTAYKLIQHNNPDRLEVKLQLNKQLIAQQSSLNAQAVEYLHCAKLEDEVQTVLTKIIELKTNNPKSSWSDFAILVRANNHAEFFIPALQKNRIPYEFLASSGLYRQPLILDCTNFLKLLVDYHESSAVYRLLCLPFICLKENDLQKITYHAKKKAITYYEALKRVREWGLSEEGIAIGDKLLNLIHNGMKQTRNEKPSTILYTFLEQSGYLAYLTKEEEKGNRVIIQQINYLNQFFEKITTYESTTTEHSSIAGFLTQYTYTLESGDEGELEQSSDPEMVKLMTVHASKGLEFKYVFVVNLVEERFPTRKRGESIELPPELIHEQSPSGDAHYQEERRLFYVAITRAKEKLFLLSSQNYGGIKDKKVSRFLDEIGITAPLTPSTITPRFEISEPIIQADSSESFSYTLPEAFSFSQLKSYESCPYQYKLANILKVPTKGSAQFSFGQTIHSTLQKFYERVQELNAIKQTTLFNFQEPPQPTTATIKIPPEEELLTLYQKCWIDDWYKDTKQKEAYYQQGKKLLKELKPGAKVASNHLKFKNWKVTKKKNDVYLYIR